MHGTRSSDCCSVVQPTANTLALQVTASNICVFSGEPDILMLCKGQSVQEATRQFQIRRAMNSLETRYQDLKELCAARALPADAMPLSVQIGFQWLNGLHLIREHGNALKHTNLVEGVLSCGRLLQETYALEALSPQQWPAGWEFYYASSKPDTTAA